MSEHEQCETPLVDLLAGIPADARLCYEHSPTHHQMIPVGRLARQAADSIRALLADVAALREELERVRALLHHMVNADEYRPETCCYCQQAAAAAYARNVARAVGDCCTCEAGGYSEVDPCPTCQLRNGIGN